MEFNKKIEEFEMFGLTFQIKKDKKTKCRTIFCDGVLITGVDGYLGEMRAAKKWTKVEIMNKFAEKCKKFGMEKEQVLAYIKEKKV